VLQSGGHLAEIVLKGRDEINPLWIQSRPTIDSDSYSPIIHGEVFGTAPESRLLSGLAGHNLCFPFWGNPTESEFDSGMTFHGETNIRRWHLLNESADSLTVQVVLPESGASMIRRMRCHGYALHVESTASNLTAWDRPVAWCEHVTFGPPFLDKDFTRFDASLGTGFVTGERDGEVFQWPLGTGGSSDSRRPRDRFDLGSFSPAEHSNLVNSFLVNPDSDWGYFTAYNSKYSLLCGYTFPVRDFPWLNVWQNNDDQIKARGMEFSNTPHHGTMKTLIMKAEMWGIPTYEWLNARSTLTKHFTAFCFPLPRHFQGVNSVNLSGETLEICEKGTAHVIQIPI
jgi:hypothetical protein